MLGNVTTIASVQGFEFRRTAAPETDGAIVKNPTLGPAKTGALTTRTDANTGVLTMESGHGIGTGNRLDVYWTNADGTKGRRYGMTVGTVSTNSVPIDGGAGDDLPALVSGTYAITAMVPRLETFPVPAADMEALFVGCGGPATAVFREDDDTPVVAVTVDDANDSYVWDANGGTTPFGADVADVYLSHGDSSMPRPVNVVAMIN